jgi:hypothetical protein
LITALAGVPLLGKVIHLKGTKNALVFRPVLEDFVVTIFPPLHQNKVAKTPQRLLLLLLLLHYHIKTSSDILISSKNRRVLSILETSQMQNVSEKNTQGSQDWKPRNLSMDVKFWKKVVSPT